MKTCEYRNCRKELNESKRKDAKFCNRSCKSMEQTYRKRRIKLLQKYKQNEELKIKLKKIEEIIKGEIQF